MEIFLEYDMRESAMRLGAVPKCLLPNLRTKESLAKTLKQ